MCTFVGSYFCCFAIFAYILLVFSAVTFCVAEELSRSTKHSLCICLWSCPGWLQWKLSCHMTATARQGPGQLYLVAIPGCRSYVCSAGCFHCSHCYCQGYCGLDQVVPSAQMVTHMTSYCPSYSPKSKFQVWKSLITAFSL